MLMSMICPAQRNNKESSWALIYYWEEWQDCKYVMDGSASSRECWKENPYVHRGFNEWKDCCGRLYHHMGLNQICWVSFEIASLMCCQLDYALKLSHGAWLVLPVKVAALRCVPCALCCVLPRSCVQPAIGPTHVAELASWKWPSFQKEVLRVSCSGENYITDAVMSTQEGFFAYFVSSVWIWAWS